MGCPEENLLGCRRMGMWLSSPGFGGVADSFQGAQAILVSVAKKKREVALSLGNAGANKQMPVERDWRRR